VRLNIREQFTGERRGEAFHARDCSEASNFSLKFGQWDVAALILLTSLHLPMSKSSILTQPLLSEAFVYPHTPSTKQDSIAVAKLWISSKEL
jgi:hypothetical protein